MWIGDRLKNTIIHVEYFSETQSINGTHSMNRPVKFTRTIRAKGTAIRFHGPRKKSPSNPVELLQFSSDQFVRFQKASDCEREFPLGFVSCRATEAAHLAHKRDRGDHFPFGILCQQGQARVAVLPSLLEVANNEASIGDGRLII
jgi:hypothetical protein